MRTGCVIMAAGSGVRFGGNKLALEYMGKPLYIRCFDAADGGGFGAVAVVSQYAEILDEAMRRGYIPVLNDRPELGVSRTIALGIDALLKSGAAPEGVMFMVADQPLLCAKTVGRLMSAWREFPIGVAALSHDGRRGNPCVFPAALLGELNSLEGDIGGGAVIARHTELLRLVDADACELLDIDTALDAKAFSIAPKE